MGKFNLKEKLKKINYKHLIKDFLIVALGNILLSFAVSFCFINYKGVHVYGINPQTNEVLKTQFNGILSGGTTGFSLAIRNLFFKNVANGGNIVESIITVTTVILFILGSLFLGKKFAVQTLLSTLFYPLFIYCFKLPIFDFLHEQFNLFDPILCAVVGGLIMGVGCGIVYKIGGSTGGFDVPGMIINKFTRIKLSIIFLFTDGLLVVLAFIANFSLYEIFIGLLSVIAYSLAVDFTQRVGTQAYICDIISDKWEDINREILALDRGTTIVSAIGGFTSKDRKMIKTMVGKNQYLQILDIVKKIDPNAFMSMTKTSDVFGEGYKDITNYSNK